jgi:UDP-N-acetylglucosamine 1-carboxyvinyltransferase
MGSLIVRPGARLAGEVAIGGAKNSVLKLMAASVLAPGRFVLERVPHISDVEWMGDVLEAIGTKVEWEGADTLVVHSGDDLRPEAPYELVEKMRASTALLGPLLARCGEARVAMPGGDDFGSRPINLHLDGLEALGATIELSHGTIIGHADRLVGARIVLEYPSVGATENLMLAATLAEGVTTIDNAAREPEIADLAAFVNRMGGKVLGAGSPTIEVEGVSDLQAVRHEVIPDRIEAATYLAAVAVAGGEVTLEGARGDHMAQLLRKVGEMGVRSSHDSRGLWVMSPGRLRATDVATLPYPGIATDYLPMLVAMLSVAEGTSFATENLFGGRFRYVGELARMGADIDRDGHHLVIRGVDWLSGAPVRAFDIRAGAALVIAGLRAEGETIVHGAEHLDRGYHRLVEQLSSLGASIERRG